MRYFTLFIATTTILTWSCKKQVQEDPRKAWFQDEAEWEALQLADFGCQGIYADHYISANLDGTPFCINAQGEDTCYSSILQTITTGPLGAQVTGYEYRFSIGDKDFPLARLYRYSRYEIYKLEELTNEVFFDIHYISPHSYKMNVVIDSFFKAGTVYPLNENNIIPDDPYGFFTLSLGMAFDVDYLHSTLSLTYAQTDFKSSGIQPATSFVQINGIDKQEFDTYYLYTIEFEFACDLYLDNNGKYLWTKLTNGKMNGVFKVEK
jgi:hypothetical protein